MARVPGTETPTNRDGWKPGDLVRGRRSRGAAAQDLADRVGVVTEVRHGNVRVLFDGGRAALWVTNETVVAAEGEAPAGLATMRRLLRELGAVRLESEAVPGGEQLVFFCASVDWGALSRAREALGPRLAALEVAPEGVHELAVRFTLGPADG